MSASISSIPAPLHELLEKLKFISMIGKNKKMNISSMDTIEGNTRWGALIRFVKREDKSKTMKFLDEVIQETIQAIQLYQSTEYIKILIPEFANARFGFQNLMETYRDFPKTVSQIHVYLTNIDLQLEKNKQYLKTPNIPSSSTNNSTNTSNSTTSAPSSTSTPSYASTLVISPPSLPTMKKDK